MSMMVGPVSRVSFKQNQPTAEELLSRPGAYSNPEQAVAPATQKPANKHKTAKIILGTLAAIAVVAGSLYAAHKFAPETFNAARKFSDIKNIEKTGEKIMAYITTSIGKAGKVVEDGGKYVANGCTSLWNKIFNRNSGEIVQEVEAGAAAATEAAAGAAEAATAATTIA